MFFTSRSSLVLGRRIVCHRKVSSQNTPELPEEPMTCCMRGCANCVWIEYAETIKNMLKDCDSEQVSKIILDKVQDPNMKAFLATELKSKGFK